MVIDELRVLARRARLDLLAGVQGHRLIVLLGGVSDPLKAAGQFAGRFGPGAVVVGPVVTDLQSASHSPLALAGLRAAPAWPDAPRPVAADDLLPERSLDGDREARHKLISEVYEPLLRGGSALLDTLSAYLEQGLSLEATARLLFVHPNTVRYRLRRIAELTGLIPTQGRGGLTLWVAIVLGAPNSQANIDCRKAPKNDRRNSCSSAPLWQSSTVQEAGMLVFAAPGQGAQAPGFLTAWLELPGFATVCGLV